MDILFTLSGEVQHSLKRGRTLGFPTANIHVTDHTPGGVFIALTRLPTGETFSSLLFVGSAITFNETQKKGEVYILDFNDHVYGQHIEVEVLHKLRDNIKFSSADDLVAQMKKDEEDARKYFSNIKQ